MGDSERAMSVGLSKDLPSRKLKPCVLSVIVIVRAFLRSIGALNSCSTVDGGGRVGALSCIHMYSPSVLGLDEY